MFVRRSTVSSRETCTLQPNMNDTKEDFQRETMKALWQVFDTLDMDKKGLVHVSQLKVITSGIGMKMGMDKAEEILKDGGTIAEMDFQTYFNIVKSDMIDKIEIAEHSNNGYKSIGERLNSVLKTCWTTCNFERNHKSKWLSFDHCLVLWRLFNFLSEVDENEEPLLPVKLDPEEAMLLLKKFVDITGQKNKETEINHSIQLRHGDGLTFTDFIDIFESECVSNLSKTDISHGLNYLQDTLLLNILGKGMIFKRGYKVKNWKERWLVLTPKEIKYYVSSKEKVLKGLIEFDSECKVEVLPDRPSHKSNRFVIHTSKKPYEMSAPDMKTKHEWVSGIQLALDHIGKDTNIQLEAARERRKARREQRRLQAEEELRRREEEENLRKKQSELDEEKRKRCEDEELLRKRLEELEEEKRRREEAEARFLEEKALKEAEQQRLRELEEIKRELERLLEEERQAKRDEEIVRNLQAKLLEEEFQRREQLELLKQQQEDMLKTERQQNAMLEEDRLNQERILMEAKERLKELESEQALAAQKMQDASDKLQRAEKDRRIMEEKVKLWKTPVGLAKPIQPVANPFVTHRGEGAFCDYDFKQNEKKVKKDQMITAENKDIGVGLDKETCLSRDDTKKDIVLTKDITEKDNGLTIDDTEKDTVLSKDITEKDTVYSKDGSEIDNILSKEGSDTNSSENDTGLSNDDTEKDTVLSKDNTGKDTLYSKDGSEIDNILSKEGSDTNSSEDDTGLSNDDTEKDTVLSKDNTGKDILYSKDGSEIDNVLSKEGTDTYSSENDTGLSIDDTEKDTVLSKDVSEKDTDLSEDCTAKDTQLSKDDTENDTMLSEHIHEIYTGTPGDDNEKDAGLSKDSSETSTQIDKDCGYPKDNAEETCDTHNIDELAKTDTILNESETESSFENLKQKEESNEPIKQDGLHEVNDST